MGEGEFAEMETPMLTANELADDELLGMLDRRFWLARAGSVALGLPCTLRKALCRAYAASGESSRAASARPSPINRIVTQTGPAHSSRHDRRPASPAQAIERISSEPFGLPTVEALEGPLVTRWRGVEREIRRDELLLARCATDRSCGSAPALRLMDIVDAA